MEQMGTFMAEYAEWFYMGSSIVEQKTNMKK